MIRCDNCDNGVEAKWNYCAWCGHNANWPRSATPKDASTQPVGEAVAWEDVRQIVIDVRDRDHGGSGPGQWSQDAAERAFCDMLLDAIEDRYAALATQATATQDEATSPYRYEFRYRLPGGLWTDWFGGLPPNSVMQHNYEVETRQATATQETT